MFVDVLRSSSTGVLDRASFHDACMARGLTTHTFSFCTAHSVVLDNPAINHWYLVPVGPDLTTAASRENCDRMSMPPGHGGAARYALDRGHAAPQQRLACFTPPSSSFTVAGGTAAQAEDGSAVGTIVVDDRGNSWGHEAFLARRGADEGDLLLIEFHLTACKAVLKLGDVQLIEDAGGGPLMAVSGADRRRSPIPTLPHRALPRLGAAAAAMSPSAS